MAAHPAGSLLHCGACNEKLLSAPDPGSAPAHAGLPAAGVHRCPLCGFLNRADARLRSVPSALRLGRPAEVATPAKADRVPAWPARTAIAGPPRRTDAARAARAVAAA